MRYSSLASRVMSSILINFGEERKVYDAPDTPVPWQKVVEVDVGHAPTVDVFFKSATQEIHVKTFKFKTQKDRRVAITVNIDATNTVTAKLVTLADVDNTDKKDDTIITLDLNGVAVAITRSSERTLYQMPSMGEATGEQFDAAAAAAALAVPPSQCSAVFIVPYMANYQYAVRKRMVEALEAAGYSNVRCVEQLSPLLSTTLKVAKPNKEVGEYVGILQLFTVHVVRKTDHGYDFIETISDLNRLRQLFPTIKELISFDVGFFEDDKAEPFQHQTHPFLVKPITIGGGYLVPYMWNKTDGGNMDGYLVTMTVQCKFRISYNGKNTVLDARAEMLPWQKAIELDIGDAATVDIFMKQDEAYHGEVHVKQFKFTSKKNRKVSISIAIDDARLPEVKLTTL